MRHKPSFATARVSEKAIQHLHKSEAKAAKL